MNLPTARILDSSWVLLPYQLTHGFHRILLNYRIFFLFVNYLRLFLFSHEFLNTRAPNLYPLTPFTSKICSPLTSHCLSYLLCMCKGKRKKTGRNCQQDLFHLLNIDFKFNYGICPATSDDNGIRSAWWIYCAQFGRRETNSCLGPLLSSLPQLLSFIILCLIFCENLGSSSLPSLLFIPHHLSFNLLYETICAVYLELCPKSRVFQFS